MFKGTRFVDKTNISASGKCCISIGKVAYYKVSYLITWDFGYLAQQNQQSIGDHGRCCLSYQGIGDNRNGYWDIDKK